MKIAMIVGHIGPGTGAVWNDRDEWEMARHAAKMAWFSLVHRDDLIMPYYFHINKCEMRWHILDYLLNDRTDDLIKANWIKYIKPDVVIDFHFNSFHDERANGHEIIAPSDTYFAQCMDAALDILPNRHRNMIINPSYRLFQHLDGTGIDAVIIEPAFIFESCIDEHFESRLITSIIWGIERFVNTDLAGALKNGI